MTLQEKREFFAKDIYASELTGICIEDAGDDFSKCSLKLSEKHCNAVGKTMGGVFYTLADFSFAVATNSDTQWTVTTNSQITYLNPVKGNTLFSFCYKIKDGKNLCTYETIITDDTDTQVALIISNGMHLGKPDK